MLQNFDQDTKFLKSKMRKHCFFVHLFKKNIGLVLRLRSEDAEILPAARGSAIERRNLQLLLRCDSRCPDDLRRSSRYCFSVRSHKSLWSLDYPSCGYCSHGIVGVIVRSPFRAKHRVIVQYMVALMKCPLSPPPPPTPLLLPPAPSPTGPPPQPEPPPPVLDTPLQRRQGGQGRIDDITGAWDFALQLP